MHYKRALLPLTIGYLFIKKIVKIGFVVKLWAPQVVVLVHDLGSTGMAKGQPYSRPYSRRTWHAAWTQPGCASYTNLFFGADTARHKPRSSSILPIFFYSPLVCPPSFCFLFLTFQLFVCWSYFLCLHLVNIY